MPLGPMSDKEARRIARIIFAVIVLFMVGAVGVLAFFAGPSKGGPGSFLSAGGSNVPVVKAVQGTLSEPGMDVDAIRNTSVDVKPEQWAYLLITPDGDPSRTVMVNDQGVMCQDGYRVWYLGDTFHYYRVQAASAQHAGKRFTATFTEYRDFSGSRPPPPQKCPF